MDRNSKLKDLLNKNIQSRVDFNQKITGVRPVQEKNMNLSQLPQYVGVSYHVVEGKKLLAVGPSFRVVVQQEAAGWYMLIHTDVDGDKYAGEYGIDLHWSRNTILSVMDSVVRYYLGSGVFPHQLKGFVI